LGTPSGRVFTHPVEITETLVRENYRIVPNSVLQRDGTAPFVRDVHQGAEQVAETALRLMGQADWDFSMVVLRLTDEIPHYFWHWMDPSHPAHVPADTFHREAVLRCYQKADEMVGKLIAHVQDENTSVFVMSDHGFGPLHKDVYLNNWLRQQGFLHLRSQPTARNVLATLLRRLGITRTSVGHSLSRLGLHRVRGALRDGLGTWAEIFPNDAQPRVAELVDWARTRAYSVGYTGQIYVNLIGRDPLGVVAPGAQCEQFLSGLIEQLQEMVDPEDGKRVVDQVLRKEEIYNGPYLPVAPDLLLVMRGYSYITRQSYEFSVNDVSFAAPPTQETGGHRQEGILIACGGSIRAGNWLEPVRIEDLAPTILHLLGCEVPVDMDGGVLSEVLVPEHVAANAVRYSQAHRQEGAVSGFTPEEEESVLEHLRNLGYIG